MDFQFVQKAQQAYKSRLIISLLVAIGALLLTALALVIFTGDFASLVYLVIAIVIAVLGIILAVEKQSQTYRSSYKAYFVEKNLAKTFTDLRYDRKMGLAKELLQSTQMINTGDVYSSNDLATGKYKDVAFTQADVHIQEENTDKDGHTTHSTIFKGRFMIFEFPKKFNFRLEVVERFFGANIIPGKNPETGRKFERIELESSEFNKIFKTYAEDGFEAFYILDPAFINNMIELGQEYKGKLLLCFVDNKLIVGLKDNKDAFEPPSAFKKLDETTEDTRVTEDIYLIINFIDKLKLDHKLFQ